MDELNRLLAPVWDAEKWILEGWNKISTSEKEVIKGRMDELFKNGLPFEMKHDKLFYIYTFSLLAQFEVLAIQVPLKFEEKMSSAKFKRAMRAQLLDEIFHGMVFTKIVYLLCTPYSFPPAYNVEIEALCNFIRNEDCPKIGVVLLNLIGEGWIEEIFYSLYRQNVAPEVFSIIIDDEHRHVGEADLYRDIGLPNMEVVRSKLDYLESQLFAIFSQYKYVTSLNELLGSQGSVDFLEQLDKKYRKQLKKIDLSPGEKWETSLKISKETLRRLNQYVHNSHGIEMTPTRQMFMTQWDNPSDPTMVGDFDVNISCLEFFNKKYPPETLTTMMLQVISQLLADNASFRTFLSHKKLYQSNQSYVAVVVKLSECGDQIGNIVFENCHLMSIEALTSRIRQVIKMMTFCYKKREQLERSHPHLKSIVNDMLFDFNYGTYAYPMPGSSMVTLSNVGSYGYTGTKSPLRSNESMRFTLLEVERKQVWNKETHALELQDILPVSISADHRIFDGNLPLPKIVTQLFHQRFKMIEENTAFTKTHSGNDAQYANEFNQIVAYNTALDQILSHNLEVGYKMLTTLQSIWPDFMEIDDFLTNNSKNFNKKASLLTLRNYILQTVTGLQP